MAAKPARRVQPLWNPPPPNHPRWPELPALRASAAILGYSLVCLSTVQGNASAFTDAGYRDGGSDPCADRADLAWTAVPTASTWHLDQSARTINFEFPEGAPVHVVAEARLGGLPAVGSAMGDGTASIGGDTLDLRLAKLSSRHPCAQLLGLVPRAPSS